jgi:hypothetical protein
MECDVLVQLSSLKLKQNKQLNRHPCCIISLCFPWIVTSNKILPWIDIVMWFPETSIKAQTHSKSNNIRNNNSEIGKTKTAINERGSEKWAQQEQISNYLHWEKLQIATTIMKNGTILMLWIVNIPSHNTSHTRQSLCMHKYHPCSIKCYTI